VDVENNMKDARALDIGRLAAGKLRVGLLDNSKPNAGRLLAYVGQLLTERGMAASTITLDKISSGSGASAQALQQLAEETDLVVTALGN
jgi:hypothetical protein